METLTPEQVRKQRVEEARLANENRRASYDSAATIVPPEFRFIETQYELPEDGETAEKLSKLSQDDLLTGGAKLYRKTRVSFGYACRDMSALVPIIDAFIARFKDERVSKNRDGKPTVREAFLAIGWNYEAARKMRQRCRAVTNGLPAFVPTSKPKQLCDGSTVQQEGDTTPYVVLSRPQSGEVEIVPEGASSLADAKIVPTEIVRRVCVKKIRANDLIRDENGNEYRYIGGGVLKRTNTPALAEKRDREVAAIAKAREDLATSLMEEKKRQAELPKAEAARHEFEGIAEPSTNGTIRLLCNTHGLQPVIKSKSNESKVVLACGCERIEQVKAKANKKEAEAKTKADLETEAKKQEEKAKQEAKGKAAAAVALAATNTIAAQHGCGVDGNGKTVFLGQQDADGGKVQQ
jgi:hypothetical protein